MKKVYLDTETCGLYGLATLVQYAYDDGPITLFEPWLRPARETVALIEEACNHCLVGFNLAFDMFHLCKLYTTMRLLPPDMRPIDDIGLVARMEERGRDGPCVKTASSLDLMLHSRRGPYQCLMARDKVRVRKIPTILAGPLAMKLEAAITFDEIMFAGRADKDAAKWQVLDRKNPEGVIDPDFKDVVLSFNASGALKVLVEHALGIKPEFKSFKEIEPATRPYELGYVPFALGVSSPDKDWMVWDKHDKYKGQAWPAHVKAHVEHWHSNELARRYAWLDVDYTRKLDEHFGYPEIGDDDSMLACMVGAVRWHGFIIDREKTSELLASARTVVEKSPVNINKPPQVRAYIRDTMVDAEALLLDQSTKKANIEKVRDELVVGDLEACSECKGDEELCPDCKKCEGTGSYYVGEEEICIKCLGEGCSRCGGKGTLYPGLMPASRRASEILKIKGAAKEVELHSKLQKAGRFHASFDVIGALSSRMSGADGLNAQGIKHSKEVRRMFPLAWDGMVLCGGDFDSFEVTLADAVFKDPTIRADLVAGKKLHAIMGMELFPGMSYDDICNSDGSKELDMYTRGKQAVFAMLYGGDHTTIHNKLAIPLPVAEAAFDRFQDRYSGIKRSRDEVAKDFQALTQLVEHGPITWTDPADYAETFLGFRRYFTLENQICQALFKMAQNIPKEWTCIEHKIVRTDRDQTLGGAAASALYGASFQLQASNIRAINNHLIQSPGAVITKNIQRRIWNLQPSGVNDWIVAPMNVHDEIMCVTNPGYVDQVANIVQEGVESYREQVPLIGMKWCKSMDNWAEKKGGVGEIVHITPDLDAAFLEALEDAKDSLGVYENFEDEDYDMDEVLNTGLF